MLSTRHSKLKRRLDLRLRMHKRWKHYVYRWSKKRPLRRKWLPR